MQNTKDLKMLCIGFSYCIYYVVHSDIAQWFHEGGDTFLLSSIDLSTPALKDKEPQNCDQNFYPVIYITQGQGHTQEWFDYVTGRK